MLGRIPELRAMFEEVGESMGLMNDHSDDPDPFAHLRGRQHVRDGARVDLAAVCEQVYDTLERDGSIDVDEITATAGFGGPSVVYDYYLGLLREELLERENEHLEPVTVVGGVTVDQDAALEGGYMIDEPRDRGFRRRIEPTAKLEREVVQDVVTESWEYQHTHGFGASEDTLEAYASATVSIFETLYRSPPIAWTELELDHSVVYPVALERDRRRLWNEALPALEHAGVRIDRDTYEFALVDEPEPDVSALETVTHRS